MKEKKEVTDALKTKSEERERTPKKSLLKLYLMAALVVAVVIMGVLYTLEKEGRSSTAIFSSMIASQVDNEVVAVINGEEIVNKDLDASIEQFKQIALAQGVDVNDPSTQAEMRNQALQVLINTKLLVREAGNRGISVSEEDVNARIEDIKTDLGGEEVLAERMASLGIEEARLYEDIGEELLIQRLLDQIFVESGVEVTDEEIEELYNGVASEGTELPPLADVSEEIKAQISSTKEQGVIDEFLAGLRSESEITIAGE